MDHAAGGPQMWVASWWRCAAPTSVLPCGEATKQDAGLSRCISRAVLCKYLIIRMSRENENRNNPLCEPVFAILMPLLAVCSAQHWRFAGLAPGSLWPWAFEVPAWPQAHLLGAPRQAPAAFPQKLWAVGMEGWRREALP